MTAGGMEGYIADQEIENIPVLGKITAGPTHTGC
jgi:hypothetical protein